jgi:gamma-glutamylcyclotransferase (GGCT)/AIG2-like uncharacterized protein YtfP
MDGHAVFVYGTLRKGECRFGIKSLVGILHEEARLKGFDMLSIHGSFPGLVEGEGTVKGEIHVFETFAELDRIEGFSEKRLEQSLYLRKTVTVSTPKGDMEASTYVFNQDPDSARESYRSVETGDWLDVASSGRPRARAASDSS